MLSGKLRKVRPVRLLRDNLVPIRQFRSVDGLHELIIFRRADGFFGYAGERYTEQDGEKFWEPAESSGIYESADEAERAALAEMTWFSGKISN
jgi:hypothetical protein